MATKRRNCAERLKQWPKRFILQWDRENVKCSRCICVNFLDQIPVDVVDLIIPRAWSHVYCPNVNLRKFAAAGSYMASFKNQNRSRWLPNGEIALSTWSDGIKLFISQWDREALRPQVSTVIQLPHSFTVLPGSNSRHTQVTNTPITNYVTRDAAFFLPKLTPPHTHPPHTFQHALCFSD